MNDLLAKSLSRGRVSGLSEKDDLERGDPAAGVQMTNMTPDENMAQFFEEVEGVKVEINKVRQLLVKLQEANEESKGIHSAVAMKALRDRMDSDIGAVASAARAIKVKLQELDRANAASRKMSGCEKGTATDRSRSTVTMNLTRKLKNIMDDFQALRAKMMTEYKDTIERRYYTVTGQQADEETIENMIRTGESETFLQQAIREQGRGHILETIREVQERHDAVKQIEKHLLELHEIFRDISLLVEVQGNMLNEIDKNIVNSVSFTARGAKHLASAKRHQRSKRKWTCICVLLLIVIILILVIALRIANVI